MTHPSTVADTLDAGHAPGPWEHGDVLYQRDFRTFVNVVSDRQSSFVACVSADPMHREAILANARLIAAAPDLLAACEYLVSLGGGDCLDTARTAIAKARGEVQP